MKYLIGVDEAGRGPLAGPLAVGAVRVAENFNIRRAFPNARDSKVLSESAREAVYTEMQAQARAGEISFCVRYSSNILIDTKGITEATRRAAFRCVRALAPNASDTRVLLDGLLHAPPEYEQETIVHGDSIEPLISLASIAAKVRRDRLMAKLARVYPGYELERHKGYGTARHRAAIRESGLSSIHRATFCDSLIFKQKSV